VTPPPFVVFALPRSRTAWLSRWLSAVAQAPVGHDLAIEADTIDQWLGYVARGWRGTCETGAVEVWPILRRSIPACRIITVHRPLEAVCASLEAAGYEPPLCDLQRRNAALEALAGQDGVLSLPFDVLDDPRACAVLQEYALGVPFDWPAWREAACLNVQINREQRLARLTERRPQIEALKAELVERLAVHRPFVLIGEERWTDVADDCERMGAVHHDEATEGIEGVFRLNRNAMLQLAEAGIWRVFTARVDGELAGYCCWTHETNLEADAPQTMAHGPFYVSPEHARHKLGVRLLHVSRDALAAEGYRVLRLHHTMHGRGARAGRLYEALGAVEYQREYLWKVGADA
jgi:GNAT superfamily N-acetyltransferase